MWALKKWCVTKVAHCIDQSRNTLQLKYCAELPSYFWANHCPFYYYKPVTISLHVHRMTCGMVRVVRKHICIIYGTSDFCRFIQKSRGWVQHYRSREHTYILVQVNTISFMSIRFPCLHSEASYGNNWSILSNLLLFGFLQNLRILILFMEQPHLNTFSQVLSKFTYFDKSKLGCVKPHK